MAMATIAIELDRKRLRPRPSLCEIRKFSSISRFEHEAQKKSRRGRGFGLDSGLEIAISRFIYSFVRDTANLDRSALRRESAYESGLSIKSIMILQVPNRRDCEELCLSETGFVCLSADYNIVTLSCALRYYLLMETIT